MLVGIELDQILYLRLFAGYVWHQLSDNRAPVTTHQITSALVIVDTVFSGTRMGG